jgi:hypothetical protein
MHAYRGQFEVHVTVRLAGQAGLDNFRGWCVGHACKCVRIELARGEHVEQPMATWRRGDTSLPVVLAEANRCATELEHAGFRVVRVKVEAEPGNADVPQADADAMVHATSNYFEHHVKLLRDSGARRDDLLQACLASGAHLSRNAWREPVAGMEERFVTLRCYGTGWNSADRKLQQLIDTLQRIGEQIIEVESEYCVYDSNLELDRGWLP